MGNLSSTQRKEYRALSVIIPLALVVVWTAVVTLGRTHPATAILLGIPLAVLTAHGLLLAFFLGLRAGW